MIIAGWICTIIGAMMGIGGFAAYNDAQTYGYGLYKYYDSGDVEAASVFLGIGVVLFVLGVVLLIVGYSAKSKNKSNGQGSSARQNTRVCLKCGNVVDATKAFCPQCGNELGRQNKTPKNE